jgi:hypothetical protein
MLSGADAELSEEEIGEIAWIIVREAEEALGILGARFEEKLCSYSDDIRYRAVAIGLIRMLGDHLLHYAKLTSAENAVSIAVEHLDKHFEETLQASRRFHQSPLGNA